MNFETSMNKEKVNQEAEVRSRIIAAAIKRFSYFGIQKTTLAEIADDTNIPRHSLNEIFADKGSLIRAAENTVVAEYLGKWDNQPKPSSDVLESLSSFIHMRLSFFEKYFMLINQKDNALFFEWSEYITRAVAKVHEKEIDYIINIIKKKSNTPIQHAEVIIKTLSALETSFRVSNPIPSPEDFEKLKEEEVALLNLFYYGIN